MQTPEVMIHINEPLNHEQQQAIESAMREIEGVIAPRFNLPHMLVILYDADKIDSATLLSAIKGQGYQAQLVGL